MKFSFPLFIFLKLFIMQVANDIPFPPLLKSFEKKDYILTLKIEENNINKSCNIYIATEINDPVEMFGNHSPSKVQSKSTKECSLSMVTVSIHISVLVILCH